MKFRKENASPTGQSGILWISIKNSESHRKMFRRQLFRGLRLLLSGPTIYRATTLKCTLCFEISLLKGLGMRWWKYLPRGKHTVEHQKALVVGGHLPSPGPWRSGSKSSQMGLYGRTCTQHQEIFYIINIHKQKIRHQLWIARDLSFSKATGDHAVLWCDKTLILPRYWKATGLRHLQGCLFLPQILTRGEWYFSSQTSCLGSQLWNHASKGWRPPRYESSARNQWLGGSKLMKEEIYMHLRGALSTLSAMELWILEAATMLISKKRKALEKAITMIPATMIP